MNIGSARSPLVSVPGLLLLLTLAGSGCDRASKETLEAGEAAARRTELPPPMSPGTLRGLGPHLFEATLDRAADRAGAHRAKDTGVRLAWSELDLYSYREVDAGHLIQEEIRIDRDLYRRASEAGPYHRLDGVPGDSLILQRTLALWDSATAPFSRRIAYDPQPDSAIEGRPVSVWRITLAPAAAPVLDPRVSPELAAAMADRAAKVLSLTGSVYVDVETGNRLLAELEGRFVTRSQDEDHDLTDEVHVTYRERRVLLDVPEDIVPPSADLVRERKIAPPPFHVGLGRSVSRGRGSD